MHAIENKELNLRKIFFLKKKASIVSKCVIVESESRCLSVGSSL